jgi:threonylcarbamoyladenosine tRNA methylthiotransferase MtaB
MKSISFYTLGCKLNYSETSTISQQMKAAGYETVDFHEGADIYVINTCSVTENADRKCKRVVREAKKKNADAKVVIIGCYAQLKPKEIATIPGVDMVLGAAEKFNLIQHISKLDESSAAIVINENIKETNVFVPGFSIGERTRSFLKVQDGCDYFCSFCTIPLARGKSRSASIEETIQSAKKVAETEVKEVVLTGVNIGDYGVAMDVSFYDLVLELDKIEGIERYRISSIEPNLLEDRIIDFVAMSDKFVPHFHIPLQSGNDDILKKMRRKYVRALYADRVKRIKERMPHACIGVDVIVGFPGEGEEEFLDTYNFIKDLDVSYLHVFPYSERANTTAKKLSNKVPEHERKKRADMLRILSNKKKKAFYDTQIGRTMHVLFESEEKDGKMYGFTENYVKVEMPYDPMMVNEIVPFTLESVTGDLMGIGDVPTEQYAH